jgi:ribosomal peptide maturation radical SAM protein 1
MKKVLLLSMPYGALERPALGLSLLKAGLDQEEIPCSVRYLTYPFAELIGHEEYRWINYDLPHTAFAGEWTFTDALYGERPEAAKRYEDEILRGVWRLAEPDIERLQRVRKLVPHFVDHCLASIEWSEYGLVGFTSTFEQNLASLALARRIKAAHPEIAVVFGGANWEGEMGEELHHQFPFVDYVCSGEAERSFPALTRRVLAGESVHTPEEPVRGIVHRVEHESVSNGPADLIRDLDNLPIPDFSDYFHDLDQSGVGPAIVPTLLLETSRGCWWGAKSHCTFCGLNGGAMSFRSKSPGRALDELEYLADRWKLETVEAVDNILDMKYFTSFLPALARTDRTLQIFYEVKSNLSRHQVRLLKEAGVHRIQPGIESLSDHVLKLMRKGTTALRNIQLLKWGREYGVEVEWNILYGFPRETREDYRDTLELLKAIRFLKPPVACGPIRMDRFSPYYLSPAEFGLTSVRPTVAYRHLYPFDAASLARIAYYFEFEYEPEVDPTGFADEVIRYVDEWQRDPEPGSLRSVIRPDGTLILLDSRSDAGVPEVALAGVERIAYEHCDELRTVSQVTRHVEATQPECAITEAGVQGFLDSLVANRLMVTDGVHYLSLALRSPRLEQPSAPEPWRGEGGAPRSARSYLPPVLEVLQA